MNTVTYEEIVSMDPCWLNTPAGQRRLKRYADRLGGNATALDILGLKRVLVTDRFWMVLREDFIAAPILHEFACRCAEHALKRDGVTDQRSWAAIQAKRDWLTGKISDEQLAAAWEGARAAARDAAWEGARAAAREAARAAAREGALEAAWEAAWAAAQAAAWEGARAAKLAAARTWQVEELTKMLLEAEKEEASNGQSNIV